MKSCILWVLFCLKGLGTQKYSSFTCVNNTSCYEHIPLASSLFNQFMLSVPVCTCSRAGSAGLTILISGGRR